MIRSRSFALNTAEVSSPAASALVLAVGIWVALTPGLGFGGGSRADTIRIYASVPLNKFASITHGAQMAIEEAGGQAGGFKIEFVPLNDAAEVDGKWNADVELANARRAAADPDAMVYIGTYNSGAAKISIPVLNRVHLAMISPGNTYPGLTKPGSGTAGEPWVYYPLGIRNYFRVVPADDLQGAAAAAYARQIGAKSVYVLDDTELYGHGVAVIFARSARDLGLQVLTQADDGTALDSESIDVRATDYSALARKIAGLHPDLVYFGGITDNHPAQVWRALREAGNFTGAFMGADGIADDEFIKQAPGDPGNVYSTLVGLPAARLPGAGADWYARYTSRFPNDENRDFAPFGYEAARVALSAINKAGAKDREAIRAAVATITSDDLGSPTILGSPWRFDANGDTSLVTISVQKLDTRWQYQGGMVYDATTKQWSFQQQ
jgi:branched-chain amino acid transport system substrate-binding protein